MKKILTIIATIFFLALFWGPKAAGAQSSSAGWYIKNFETNIVVNQDSSLTVTENILADCGSAPDKHGIFRVLPLQGQKTATEIIKTPVKLISITNFNNQPYNYQESVNQQDHTITWKIGDPNITIQGENGYRITYQVKNAIRFDNNSFDELYWNLNGNFWDLTTAKFSATISFPPGIDATNTQTVLYSGAFGQKDAGLAKSSWEGNSLKVESLQTLQPKEGITVSVTTPKNIFTPYKLTSEDDKLYQGGTGAAILTNEEKKMANTAGIVWLAIAGIGCYLLWRKYGRDPKINRAVAPEFEIPENLTPIEMGMIDSSGVLKNNYISATIINLAVKNIITIEVIGKKSIFDKEDYKLKVTGKNQEKMDQAEKLVFEKLFEGGTEKYMSTLHNMFYVHLPVIEKSVSEQLNNQGLIIKTGNILKIVFCVVAMVLFFAGLGSIAVTAGLAISVFASAIIVFVFGFLMPARTTLGAELEMRIKGFQMYMETAEKYRQQFNERENLFEQLLPYAILFGITKKWLNTMKSIYGEEYFATYQPLWLQGAMMTGGHFDLDNFSNTLDAMTSNMASTIASAPSSSGAGGGGFSGGGGGGGGGGGW